VKTAAWKLLEQHKALPYNKLQLSCLYGISVAVDSALTFLSVMNTSWFLIKI
jgi:hypothetical protein